MFSQPLSNQSGIASQPFGSRISSCGRIMLLGLALAWLGWVGLIWPSAAQPTPAAPAVASEPDRLEGRPTLRIFTDRDGLPQNTVTTVTADHKGYIWVGTQDGVTFYNGQRWGSVTLPTRNRSNYVYTILPAGDGGLWFGTNGGGLAYLKDGNWLTYDHSNGLPADQIRGLLETEEPDKSRILWVGTSGGGLARLHQGSWTVFNKDNSPLPHNGVFSLMADQEADGSTTLWVGTVGGLVRIRKSGLGSLGSLEGLESQNPSKGFRVLKATRQKRPDSQDSQASQASTWTVFTKENSGLPHNGVFCLLKSVEADGARVVWAGTAGGGLAALRDGKWTAYTKENSGLPHNIVRCLLETTDKTGQRTLWVGTYGGGVASLKGDNWSLFDKRTVGLPNDGIWSLNQTKGTAGVGMIWIGTASGLVQFCCGKWKTYTQAAGLANNLVFSLLESTEVDGSQSMWVGTGGGGLVHLRKRPAASGQRPGQHPDRQGGGGGSPTVREGGATSQNPPRFSENWTVHTTDNSPLPGNRVLSLLETGRGTNERTLWIGTNGGGLASLKGGSWKTFNTKNSALSNDLVWCLAETVDHETSRTLWVGTYGGGLARLSEKSLGSLASQNPNPKAGTAGSSTPKTPKTPETGFEVLNSQNSGLPNDRVFSLLATTNWAGAPVLWVGTDGGGLARLEQNQWTVFDSKNSPLPNNTILSLFESTHPDGRHTLWVGTSSGLAFFDPDTPNPQWTILTDATKPALPNNTISHIRADASQRVYVCTNRGILRLTPEAGRSGFSALTFTLQDGLPSNECNQGASLLDRYGQIWVGTAEGIAIFNPAEEIEDRTSKALYVEQVVLNGKPAAGFAVGRMSSQAQTAPSLNYRENNLVFEYALLSFAREADTQYQTQLVGYDGSPSEWTGKSAKEYTNLPDGEYRFQVWGRDYAGNVSGPVEVGFTIRPAPWRTWWAFMLYAAIFVGTGIGILQWRMKTIQHRQRRQVEELRRRQQQRIETLRQLLESIRVINSELDLTTVLQLIAEESARLIEGRPAGIGLVEGNLVVFKRMWLNEQWVEKSISFPLDHGIAATVAATGQGLIVNDTASPLIGFPELWREHQVSGLIAVPVLTRNGKVVGVLAVFRRERPFTASDQQLLESLAHQAAVAIENAALYGELEEKNLLVVESMRELETLFEHEQKVTRALQEINEMKSNFMTVTAHEMRTPLTVLRGYTEAIISEMFGPLTNIQRNSLEACRRMVDRMVNSVEGIQEMLSISAGTVTLKPIEFDLRVMLDEIVQRVSEPARSRNLRITAKLPESIRVSAHEEKIRLVFFNLLQNAIKFSYDGGEIRLEAVGEADRVEVTVTDEGIGIDAEELERIFEKFYTTHDTSTHTSGQYEFSARGIGLGLAIAKSYVEAHGGRIWVESAGKGAGSRFHVVLPSLVATAPVVAPQPEDSPEIIQK